MKKFSVASLLIFGLIVAMHISRANAATWSTGSTYLDSHYVATYFYGSQYAQGKVRFSKIEASNPGEKLIMSDHSEKNGWSLVITGFLNKDNTTHVFKTLFLKSEWSLPTSHLCSIFSGTINEPHVVSSGLALIATCTDDANGNTQLEILAYPLN